jgi:hypothetical protein
MITLHLTEQEAIIIKDALTDKKINLRTIHSPAGDRDLTEQEFLSSDITDKRRSNYFTCKKFADFISDKLRISNF